MSEQKKLTNEEVAAFCRQMSIIISAGITPIEGMSIIINDTISEEGKKLLQEISDYCREGFQFYQALKETGVFPEYVVKLIALGEETGNTDSVMTSLADYYEREDDIADNIRSAVTYPLIMIGMMMVIIFVMIVKVLPIFKQVFDQLGTEMTPLAEKLMKMGNSLSKYAIVLTVVLAVVILVSLIVYRIPVVKHKIHNFFTVFPLTRDFYDNVASGRFASGMFLTFSSGMDTFQGLEMTGELVDNKSMKKKIDIVSKHIQEQDTFPEALEKAEIFSSLYSKMIAVAFNAGNVDNVMKHIANLYEEATEKKLRKMLSIIEPTLVIVLSLIVGMILMSVLLPLMGIMSSIG